MQRLEKFSIILIFMGKTFFLSGTAKSDVPVWEQFQDLVLCMAAQGFSLSKKLPADYLISMNYSKSDYELFIRSGGTFRESALVLLEPRSVYPLQYKDGVLRKYSLILRPGNPEQYELSGDFIGWPYEVNPNPLMPSSGKTSLEEIILKNSQEGLFNYENWIDRTQFITLINSNKVSAASIENYTLRRRFAHEIDPELLLVYGDLWNSTFYKKFKHRIQTLFFSIRDGQIPNIRNIYGQLFWKYSTAKGSIIDKQEVLQKTKFSIVIENDPSYVSEKIFDAMINGCIPLYFGPKISNELVPLSTYIKLPDQPQQMLDILESIKPKEIVNLLISIEDYLKSSLFTTIWGKDMVYANIGKKISAHFGGNDA